MYRPPPEYPSASSSPTIIMLVAGLTGVVGFLIGFLVGLGSLDPSAGPAPRVAVTVQDQPPVPAPTGPAVPDPAASDPAAPDPAASDSAVPDPATPSPDQTD